jgi:Tol biopolymer transport system component
MRFVVVLFPLVALSLAACNGAEEEVQPSPTASPAVVQPTPSPTATSSPTDAPSPASEPTATPAPLRIFFKSDREPMGTYLMDADGSNLVRIGSMLGVQGVGVDIWSPDGSRVAFVTCPDVPSSDSEIHVVNADGSGEVNVSNNASPDIIICYSDAPNGGIDWSPDGTRLVFYSFRDPSGLYVVNADGSGLAFLADGIDPSWSPDGESIAFMGRADFAIWEEDLEVIKADGSDRRVLARIPCLWSAFGGPCWTQVRRVSWSPDGAYIVFAAHPPPPIPDPPPGYEPPPDFNSDVYTLRDDGTGLIKITDSPSGGSGRPRWVDCSRPTAGCEARVTNIGPEGLNLREGTGLDASTAGKLNEGDVVCLIGPPSFTGGFKWWPLHAADGAEGWAAAFDPGEVNKPWLTATGETCEGEPAG